MRLYITAFTIGFSILFLEIIGSRIISPVYGNTVFVWSGIIGITIASLALGYYLGGKFSKRWNVGYPIIAGSVYFPLILIIRESLMATTVLGVQFGSIIAATMVLAYPLTMLGMCSPMLVQSSRNDKGVATGNIFAVGTAGSFLGAILTGFLLIPSFPISSMLIGVAVLPLVTGLGWVYRTPKLLQLASITVVPFAAVVVFVIATPNVAEGEVFEKESLYGNIKVVETEHHRKLYFDGALQSITKHNNESLMAFTQYSVVPLFYTDVQDVLVLGLGSGSIEREYDMVTTVNMDTVEIDPEVVRVARDYFDFDGNVIVGDARHFMATTDKKYDAVIYDLSKGDSYPTHLFTVEAINTAKSVLDEDGILVIHQSGSIDSKMIRAYHSTVSEVFETTKVINFENTSSAAGQMKVIIATDGDLVLDESKVKMFYPFTEGDDYIANLGREYEIRPGQVITDDLNPLDVWQLEYAEEWRDAYWN